AVMLCITWSEPATGHWPRVIKVAGSWKPYHREAVTMLVTLRPASIIHGYLDHQKCNDFTIVR
ncbi:MAG TPA: hypothetical protein PK005_08190, partial [Bacteroidales bacterium]|nr:hypothetical protein [Bacteroidales bacterium]